MTKSPTLLLAAALALAGSSSADAATVLHPNDVQIVAFASDAPDAIAFVTWVELEAGTEVRFTDRGWACGGFQPSGETELRFTAQSTVPAGSVFEYEDNASNGPEWDLLSGTFSLTGDPGDQIIVYQGTLESPTPIFAFDTTDGWEDCSAVTDNYKSALPDGLVDGVSAVTMAHSDSFWYRPWYAKSATLDTLKEWMVDRNRFKTTSITSTRVADFEAPTSGFTIRAGQSGTNGYTEYIPGTAACIILTGHDGDFYPDDIVDRNSGCWDGSACDWSKTCSPQDTNNCDATTWNDANTQDMARRANDYFEAHTGYTCHLVVNRLARVKLDPNREIGEAAQNDQTAIDTYNDFHNFAEMARMDIETNHPCGAGMLIDFHGHIHPEARIEMGYKLSGSQLRENDAYVNGLAFTSSMKNMPTHKGSAFSAVVRGSSSMGALFELSTALNTTGYESVPSPTVNAPAVDESYFQGGYNIEAHGSQNGGKIDGIQIEFPSYLRTQEFGMQADMLAAFGEVVIPQMFAAHYPIACDVLGATAAPSTLAPTNSPVTPAPTDAPVTLAPTDSPVTPAPTDAPVVPGLVAYDMVNSASHGLISYTNDFTDAFSSSWDGFQKYQRGNGGFIPPYFKDDGNDPNMASVDLDGRENGSCCGFFYKYGIVEYSDNEEFFGVVDTDASNSQNTDVGTATWQFDVAGYTDLAVSIDVAAFGNFEGSGQDFFKWTASIDGGNTVDIFQSTVDTSSTHTYTLSDGYTKNYDDPMMLDEVVLKNTFQTFTKSLASLNISPSTGGTLTLQLEARTNSSYEPIAFRNIKIY
uniref:Peptidase M14 carboxypeptidase A domain-containing protein n=1 Tax=Odontella aurita TaxID=265563 RepID=A0A7S4MX42_9STRA|mmetsp:Transcript_36490/g.109647  ORF Transcript_36490/g.109647 Transcript_36490/m.109647 type:complete len:809 (+) Transcript_36490:26-2452(+)